jgi:hypothetical protein
MTSRQYGEGRRGVNRPIAAIALMLPRRLQCSRSRRISSWTGRSWDIDLAFQNRRALRARTWCGRPSVTCSPCLRACVERPSSIDRQCTPAHSPPPVNCDARRGPRSPSLISLLILLINTTLIRCLAGNNSAVATRRLGGWWCVLPPARAVSECVRATQNKCAFRPVSIRQTLPNGPCGRNKNSGHRVIADRQTTLFVRSGSHQRLC